MDNVQWKFYIIPDYENDKSVLVLKAHHSLADGIGFAHFFLALSDDYNSKNINALKSILQSLLVNINHIELIKGSHIILARC